MAHDPVIIGEPKPMLGTTGSEWPVAPSARRYPGADGPRHIDAVRDQPRLGHGRDDLAILGSVAEIHIGRIGIRGALLAKRYEPHRADWVTGGQPVTIE
jgi:hypothetical protein